MYYDFQLIEERISIKKNLGGWYQTCWENLNLHDQISWAEKITGDCDAAEVAEMYAKNLRGEDYVYQPVD